MRRARAESTPKQVTGDADGGDRNVIDNRERAVVDDAAVPVLVDVARLSPGE